MSESFEFPEPRQLNLDPETTLKLAQVLIENPKKDFVLMKKRQGIHYFVVFGFVSIRKDEKQREYMATHIYPLNKFLTGSEATDYAKGIQDEILKRGNWHFFPDDLISEIAFAKNTTHIPANRLTHD